MGNALGYGGPRQTINVTFREEIRSIKEKSPLLTRGYGKNTRPGRFLIREIPAIPGISFRETGELGHGSRFEIIVPKDAFVRAQKNRKVLPDFPSEPVFIPNQLFGL
jgi:hypothetical protein